MARLQPSRITDVPTQQAIRAISTALDGLEGRVDTVSASAASVAGTVLTGSGSPEGVVAASVGVLYLRSDGGASTTLYVKESGAGNTGWVAK